jgi:hypothetical protein
MTHQERTQHWQQQLDNWRDSGLSGAVFCKQHEMSYHQFTYWRRKRLKADGDPLQSEGTSGFARVTCLPSQPMDELTLALPGGLTITGMHAGNIELLGMILRQL